MSYFEITKSEKEVLDRLELPAQAWCLGPLKAQDLDYTLEDIENEAVFQTCKDLSITRTNALFYGPIGSGKTFSAKTVLRHRGIHRGEKVFFHTTNSMMDQINALTFQHNMTPTMAVGTVVENMAGGTLLLDDVGREKGTEWSNALFPLILEAVTDFKVSVILTTNGTPDGDTVEPRLMSRMMGLCPCKMQFDKTDKRVEAPNTWEDRVDCGLPDVMSVKDMVEWGHILAGVPSILVGKFDHEARAAICIPQEIEEYHAMQDLCLVAAKTPILGMQTNGSEDYYDLDDFFENGPKLINNCDIVDNSRIRDNVVEQLMDRSVILEGISRSSAKYGWANKWLYSCVTVVRR